MNGEFTPGLLVTLVIGVVSPIAAAWATVKVAQIRASRTPPPSSVEERNADTAADRTAIESFTEFREWTIRRMEWQDDRIKVLEGALAKVSEKYTLIKEAFREFYREVRALLGTGTPTLDAHVRELLTEQDLDNTFGSADLARLNEQNPGPPPPAPTTASTPAPPA